MPRFYLPEVLCAGKVLSLPENVVRHVNVLRLKSGADIVLFNGDGRAYPARLTLADKRHAEAEILRAEKQDSEPALKITLVQAVSGGEKMDFTLQKSVELGVADIVPIISERCVVRLSGERAEKRVARWQEIAVSACEQCGRNVVPTVRPLLPYREALRQMPSEKTKLLMSVNNAKKLGAVTTPHPDGLILMIGPEGGWTDEEERLAFEAGFQAVTLGPRILRTETASLAALAAMQALWGDFA